MMPQGYNCPGCGRVIVYGSDPCPRCNCSLAWAQQGPVLYLPPTEATQQQAGQPAVEVQRQQVVQPAADLQSTKKTTNPLVIILAVIGGIVLLFGTCAICVGNSNLPATISNSTPTQVDDGSIKAGMYKVGKDIQSGEYVLFSTGSVAAYFEVAIDSSGTLNSIITNDNFNGNRYITVADGQYIEFSRAKMFPANNAPILQPIGGKYPEGMYKVGRDIIAGEYKVVSDGSTSYLEVASDSSGILDSIVTNDNFNGEKYITIKDGQYIKCNRCYIVK